MYFLFHVSYDNKNWWIGITALISEIKAAKTTPLGLIIHIFPRCKNLQSPFLQNSEQHKLFMTVLLLFPPFPQQFRLAAQMPGYDWGSAHDVVKADWQMTVYFLVARLWPEGGPGLLASASIPRWKDAKSNYNWALKSSLLRCYPLNLARFG